MQKEEKQYNKMIKTPVKKLVLVLGIPTTISMLVTSIYNIADTFFVSNIGEGAAGAVGVVFPLMAIVQAIGFTFGMGASSMISSKLGEKKDKDAQKLGSSAFYVALALGILLAIFSMIFIKPLMKVLGATDTNIGYAMDYAKYIIYGYPIMIGSFVLNNILRSEGKALLSMIGLTTGGVLNIILDPIFINTFDMGISGAAVATLISQAVSFIILLSMFVFKKSIITLSIKHITKESWVYKDILKIGFPSLCRQGLASIATIFLNNQAGTFGGDAALDAMSIVSKIFMVVFSVSLGIGQGYQPVCGYNYFAKKYDRVKEAMIFTLICGFSLMLLTCMILFVFAENVMGKAEVVAIGSRVIRYQSIAMPFLSLNVIANMSFQSTKKKFAATILSCCRQGIFFIPFIFALPALFDLGGVEMTQALSDFCTFLFTIPFYIKFVKELNSKIKIQKEEEKTLVIA